MYGKMKYKNYEWPNNPKNITVEQEKNLKEINIPFVGSCLQEFGDEKRVAKGEGEFFGENAIGNFNELYSVYRDHGSGILDIPGVSAFNATFKSLKMIYDPTPNYVAYRFEFWEDGIGKAGGSISEAPDFHIVAEGETLFDIANTYKTTVGDLMKLNPEIKRPDELIVGSRVMLK